MMKPVKIINYLIYRIIFVFIFISTFPFITQAATNTQGAFDSAAAQEQVKTDENTAAAMERFQGSIELVKDTYVDSLSDQEILDKAMVGLLSQLDPHSEYLDEEEYKALNIATSGEFVGIGAEVTMKDKMIEVVSPLDDSPAQKAGILSGDIILKINNTPMEGMSLEEAIKLIRGKPGTSLSLTIERKNLDKPLVLNLTRENIKVGSVKEMLIDGHYGYIRISNFQEDTAEDLHKAIDDLLEQTHHQLKGVILDLRNNPGGLLPISVEVASTFLDTRTEDDNVIVSVKGRSSDTSFIEKETPGEKDQTGGVPVVTLINEGSASASEIVAAALQDHHRAVIMGEQSFGKGSVQSVVPLPDGKTAIKITTARFYSPSGRPIQGEGVTPDVKVEALKLDTSQEGKKAQEPQGTQETQETEGDLNFHETDLPHALKPERPEVSAKLMQSPSHQAQSAPSDQPSNQANNQSDYQLMAAVNLLKGLSALNPVPKPLTPKAAVMPANLGVKSQTE